MSISGLPSILPLSTAAACGAAAFGLSWALTLTVRQIAVKRAVLDHPNERSSHGVPTPTGGGLGVLLALIISWLGLDVLSLSDFPWLPFGIALLGLAWISWMDDLRGVTPLNRILVQLAAVFVVFLDELVGSIGFTGHPLWLIAGILLILALAWVWFINLYNFMDGIDGLAGIETISIAVGGLLILQLTGSQSPWAWPLVLIIAVTLGFLILNWHPAKIFLGDVGSVPFGFLLGWILIDLTIQGFFAPAILLPLYYLMDATLTLARRAINREKVWQAHRSHFYQQATAKGWSHARVSMLVAVCNIGLMGLASWSATTSSLILPMALGMGWVALFLLLFRNQNYLAAQASKG